MKVLIAGGGIGGMTAALCLAQDGHHVDVLEQSDSISDIGAGIQLSPNCTRVLHHLGLEQSLQKSGFLPEGTEVRAWNSGKIISSSELGTTAVQQFGFPYYHIHRADLIKILFDAAASQPNIHLHLNTRVEQFQDDGQHVTVISNGKEFNGDLLLGADGIHSAIRAGLWGEEQPTFTGNIAWRALVPTNKLPDNLIKPMATVWWGPGKHFVHYYVRGGEFVNCVCVVEKSGWQVESWNEPGSHQELKADFKGWHSDIQYLIDQANPDSLFKWALFDRPPMPAWSTGRVTLLGDACHSTLPFMAQGAAMAIEDSAALAISVNQASTVQQDLKRYESLRLARTAGVQNGSRRNARVFHMSGIQAWARNIAAKRASGSVMNRLYSYNVFDT